MNISITQLNILLYQKYYIVVDAAIWSISKSRSRRRGLSAIHARAAAV